MTCGLRLLNFASLAFGLMSFGALSLAIVTDFWIYIVEPVNNKDNYTFIVHTHAGLWRMCVSLSDESDPMPTVCSQISYFEPQHSGDGSYTQNAIMRATRKSMPAFVSGVAILVFALGFSTVGNYKRNGITVVGAALYTFSALTIAVGAIFYITAVNNEVPLRRRWGVRNPGDKAVDHIYGWSFILAGSSFIFSLVSAVTNMSVYMKRHSKLKDMVTIIPGLDKRGIAVSTSRELEESDMDPGSENTKMFI